MDIVAAVQSGQELDALDALAAELARCDDLPRLRDGRAKLEAIRKYYATVGDKQREMNTAAAGKILHERRIGQVLGKDGATKGIRKGQMSHDATFVFLDELEMTRSESSRCKAIARVPQDEFSRVIRLAVQDNRELTSRELYLLGMQYQRREAQKKRRRKRAEAAENGRAGMPPEGLWEVRQGDVDDRLPEIEPGSVRLIFADPPYNIGVDYGPHCDDSRPPEEYEEWCRDWLDECHDKLAPDGSLWLLCSHEWAARLRVHAEEIGFHLRQWITWYETFGVNCTGMFNLCSRPLLWLVKDRERFVFNEDDPEIRRRSARLERDDPRANPEGKIWDDVWGVEPRIPRLCSNFPERMPEFPTQLPLGLLRPVVACASTPGDLVLDPFSGSGTTGCACIELSRRFVGIELSEEFCRLSRERLRGHGEDTTDVRPAS